VSTSSLLDLLEIDLPAGWSRSTGSRSLLSFVQKGQDRLFKALGRARRYIGTDNDGFEPYLKTVDGVYGYDIIAENLSCGSLAKTIGGQSYEVVADIVTEVFVDSTEDYGLDFLFLGSPYLYGEVNPYYVGNRRLYVRNLPVDSSPRLEDTPAHITFKDNPGDSTNRFFCGFLWLPPRLVSENIPLVVPEEFEEAIADYVRACLQKSEQGAESDLMKQFVSFWIPQFTKAMRRNANAAPKFTEPMYW
jgi:hypothetical protein